jgi:hypothetical protein
MTVDKETKKKENLHQGLPSPYIIRNSLPLRNLHLPRLILSSNLNSPLGRWLEWGSPGLFLQTLTLSLSLTRRKNIFSSCVTPLMRRGHKYPTMFKRVHPSLLESLSSCNSNSISDHLFICWPQNRLAMQTNTRELLSQNKMTRQCA